MNHQGTDNALSELLHVALDAALKAGSCIAAFQKSASLGIRIKRDLSPVTRADKMAQEAILPLLNLFGFPVISEEDGLPSWNKRRENPVVWIVDPLDGTKEYIARRPEYTVNIALARDGIPVLGVVYAPACGLLYYGAAGTGSFKIENIPAEAVCFSKHWTASRLPLNRDHTRPYRVVVSRSHPGRETRNYIRRVIQEKNETVEVVSAGSSLKICMIAEGSADLYPRFGRTMEWDTAAAHAVLLYAGGKIRLARNESASLEYNKEFMDNPGFIASR